MKARIKPTFYVDFSETWFEKGDILTTGYPAVSIEVLSAPHKVWYKLILQFISFGFYKAPLTKGYKVILIEN